jgi:hypothetical protein
MPVMIVRETFGDDTREFELNRENLRAIEELTGLDFAHIYTRLNSGEAIEHSGRRWVMVRQ